MVSWLFCFLYFTSSVSLTSFYTEDGPDVDYSKNGTVYYTAGKYRIAFGVLDVDQGVAYGIYQDTIQTNGWGKLDIVSGTGATKYSDRTIMFAAGYLEGALTAKRINQNYVNNYDICFRTSSESLVEKTKIWFDNQEKWMRDQITKGSSNSTLWRQLGNIIAQYDGLIAGYLDHPDTEKANLTKFAFQLFNGIGDFLTIRDVLNPKELPNWDKMTKDEILAKVGGMGHCSALIKVLPGYENIFAGHSR